MAPTLHPQAKFDPIPPDLDLHELVDTSRNLDWVMRLGAEQIRRLGAAGFEKLVQLHVIEAGRPLVVEGWDRFLPKSLFGPEWLEKTYDKKQENVRDIGAQADIPMTTGHYLRSMRQLTNQWNANNYQDPRRQRLYLKDIDCPPEWHDHLRKIIPPNVFYMNENVTDNSGSDSSRGDDLFGTPDVSAAVAGDLMSSLPEEMRAQNLMCYIGHEGTYTPAHREMCASLGQNIMVEASSDENGEKTGSSIWFMTETKDREVVREYFLSVLGHDIEIEKHFAQINAWKKATFPVYVVEQKPGDFILIPPLAPHQVWNRGTRTMKVAWNRTTVETLGMALHEALPKARLVCRDEQYKNKAIIYYTLDRYYKELQSFEETPNVGVLGFGQELTQNSPRLKQLATDFRRLFGLFTEILVDEMFGVKHTDVEYIEFDSNITCSYCRSNIFNKFLTCKCCVRQLINGDEDTYDICMECYAMGRSCVCISRLQWCEQFRWSELTEKHEQWRTMVIKQDGFVDLDLSPQPLEIARKKAGKKPVAQICQEQLRRRPWNDIAKPNFGPLAEESEPEPEVDDEGRVKKKARKRKAKKGDLYRCHVCCHKDNTYKLNFCTTCSEAYCYGVLWRAFDTMPQVAMEKEHWQCPKCLGICNCGACRRTGNTTPYVPKSTLLGHDTRHIADDRSVESVVDFRVHNLNWLKTFGEDSRSKDTKRMQRLREEADAEKAKDPTQVFDTSEDAPHEVDPSLEDTGMQNAYGQHIGMDGAPLAQDAENAGTQEQAAGSQVPMADMSGGQVPDESIYPEPSTYPDPSGRMMGMGFYDQDQSSDKILFDPFQEPSEDVLRQEPEMSEFLKKTLRNAKRKARLETDDDPDFMGPKTHHRKKPKTGHLDQLVNLDPALFGTLGESGRTSTGTPDHPNGQPGAAEDSGAADGVGNVDGQEENIQARAARARLPVELLQPILRHANPNVSYKEPEEEVDDPEDIIPAWDTRPPKKPKKVDSSGQPANTPIDAEIIDTEMGGTDNDAADTAPGATSETPAEVAHDETDTPQLGRGSRRRGRPTSSLAVTTPSSSPGKFTIASGTKRRGRPPRRSLLSAADDANESTVAGNGDDQENADGEPDEEAMQENNGTASTTETLDTETEQKRRPTARRGRGRPPRQSHPSEGVQEQSVTPAPPKLISMKERMAARGKSFKIRGASKTARASAMSNGSATHTSPPQASPEPKQKPSQAQSADEDFPAPTRELSASSETDRSPPPPQPTVVRLTDSSSTEESDSSFDDGDEDIPARKYVAPRGGLGRVALASRGRSRGQGRGRGRGRA